MLCQAFFVFFSPDNLMIIPLRKVEVLVIHQRSHPRMQPVMSIQSGYSEKKFISATCAQ
jgi:hypothetical protein